MTAWFTEARFAMFIHFGLYSLPAGVWKGECVGRNDYAEWIEVQGNWPHGLPPEEYRALAGQFNPARFDADEWIEELVRAEMRYLVITSKHHDGFALWPSRVSGFNVVDATPFRRDILGELKRACDRCRIPLGLYYSHWLDWEHPGGGRPHERDGYSGPWSIQPSDEQFEIYWREKCLPQIAELSDAYAPALFWFDTWNESSTPFINERRLDELIALVKSKNPACLINSRIGVWGHPAGEALADFHSMGDNCYPEQALSKPWETSGTLNESWGYHRLDFRWKDSAQLVGHLIHNVSLGGNYQLNVGPTADGTFQPAAIRRLREIGGWLLANGESIHGAGPAGLPAQAWGCVTARTSAAGKRCLYLHLIGGKAGEKITVAGLTEVPARAKFLETNEPLTCQDSVETAGLTIVLPAHRTADPMPRVVVLEY